MGEKNNIPQIRFKGFAENWKITKLNNISDIIGGGTPSTNVPEYWDGDIDWYSPTEIGDKVFATGSVKKITSLGLEKSSAKILPKRKTVLFTSRAGIGDMAILNKDGATNQGFQSLVLKNGIEPYFIYTAGHLIKKYALKHASGSTFLEVSGKQLGEMNLLIPTECEQSQIGTYFQNLDKLITLQQQKHDKLVTLKKAMLDKMFPKEGADVPEIRFKGFTEAWKERRLGEVMDVTSVKRIHQSNWTNTGIRFLRARDIVSTYKNEDPVEYLYISVEKYCEYSLISGKVKPGDLLVTGVGTIGVPLLIKNDNPVYFKDGNIIWFKNENAVDGNFFYYSFISNRIQRYVNESAGIGTVGTYTIESGKKTPLNLPDKKEQILLGTFFKQLDNLIIFHNYEIQKLKNIKKACLEKMFV